MTHAHDLQDHECATSLISCTLSGDPNSSYSSGTSNTYYCVGTAYVFPEEAEPKTGRLILFQLLEGDDGFRESISQLVCQSVCQIVFFFFLIERQFQSTFKNTIKAFDNLNDFFVFVFKVNLSKSLIKKSKVPCTHWWNLTEKSWPALTARLADENSCIKTNVFSFSFPYALPPPSSITLPSLSSSLPPPFLPPFSLLPSPPPVPPFLLIKECIRNQKLTPSNEVM